MPIVVEVIENPSENDLIDLQKIYADAPTWMYEEFGELEFVATRLQEQEGRLFAARFNDRLLGSCWVIAQDDGSFRVRWLNVRKATRGRGVGARLLVKIKEAVSHAPLWLASRDSIATDALLKGAGFERHNEVKDRTDWFYAGQNG